MVLNSAGLVPHLHLCGCVASRELEGKAVGVDDHGGVIAEVARGVGGHEHGEVATVTGAAYRKDTVILDQ